MLLDLGALVLEMHRHGRFLPDSLQRRAAEAVGTDAELRALSRSLEAGDGNPDLVAAGVAGNCGRCGALHTIGASFCSQCGNELSGSVLPRKAALGSDPELAGGAPVPRRTVAAAPAAVAAEADTADTTDATQVMESEAPPREAADEVHTPDAQPAAANGGAAPPPIGRRARATRVRQRLDEPARPTQALPTGLIAGIAAGLLVIVVGILVLSSGGDGDNESDRAAQTPAQNEPEPPPPDEVPSPSGTPPEEEPTAPATALEPVEDVTASDYDPSGDDQEHGEEAQLAVDGDASTSWPTEEYDTGSLQKDGVGLALAPATAVPARGLDLQTTTPGFDMTIYGAEDAEAPTSIDSGWTQIASEDAVERKGRIDLDTAGRDFSHYLIWITAVPDDENKVEIAEAQLLR
jgi:hypothetical protein